jgi:hypothetical protein
MSDTDLRRILDEVIADLDTGRVVLPRPRGFRLGALLAGPALAAGMALAGCQEPQTLYGVPPTDGQVADATVDSGPVVEYAAPDASADAALDDGAITLYSAPPDSGVLDGGAVPEYGGPPTDAGPDGGPVPLYQAPPPPRA